MSGHEPPPQPNTNKEALIINPYSSDAEQLALHISGGQQIPLDMVQAVLMAQHNYQQAIFAAHAAPNQAVAPPSSSTNGGITNSVQTAPKPLPATPLGSTLSPLPGTPKDAVTATKARGASQPGTPAADVTNRFGKGRRADDTKEPFNASTRIPVTPPFPSPHTPSAGSPLPSYSPTEHCLSGNEEEPPKTAPHTIEEEDSESEDEPLDEIRRFEAMDEEGQWFEIEAAQERYPQHMRDKKGETDEAKLLANEAARDAHDKANPAAALEGKTVLRKRLKKERQRANKNAKKR